MLNTFARTLRPILNINIEKRDPFSTQNSVEREVCCGGFWKLGLKAKCVCGKGSRMTYKTVESRRHLVENRMPEARWHYVGSMTRYSYIKEVYGKVVKRVFITHVQVGLFMNHKNLNCIFSSCSMKVHLICLCGRCTYTTNTATLSVGTVVFVLIY